MADKLLKVADQADALQKSKERSGKIKALHEAISERSKIKILRQEDDGDIENEAAFVKRLEKTLSPTWSQDNQLERLFYKYKIK